MANFYFENLEVYKKGLSLSIDLCRMASDFPQKFSRIGSQLIGAGTSIPLNIAEGSDRLSNKEKSNFYKISRTSAFECIPILEICSKLSLMDEMHFQDFRNRIEEISKMLNGLIKSLQSHNS